MIASALWYQNTALWFILAFVLCVAVRLSWANWRFFVQWLEGVRAQSWPTILATIDNVSVAEQVESAGRSGLVTLYLVTLTYFYRNPELQAGEYRKLFNANRKDDAHDWANSYKGKIVTVHVDPRDPTRSVLRKEDL